MRLYLDHSSKAGDFSREIVHTLYVAPAADKFGKPSAAPTEWVDDSNVPLSFELRFVNGMCDTSQSGIPDSVANYAIERGIARKYLPLLLSRGYH